jgi:hypothetical protein
MPLALLDTDKCNAYLFCSSRSLSTLLSDAGKRAVDRAVARSVNVVPDSSLTLPCLFKTILTCEKLGELESKLRQQRLRLQPQKVDLG